MVGMVTGRRVLSLRRVLAFRRMLRIGAFIAAASHKRHRGDNKYYQRVPMFSCNLHLYSLPFGAKRSANASHHHSAPEPPKTEHNLKPANQPKQASLFIGGNIL
jgi:hypothetical protein